MKSFFIKEKEGKRRMGKLWLLLVLFALFVFNVSAVVPDNISVTFQFFNASTGLPINGTHTTFMQVQTASSGGSVVINETKDVDYLNGVGHLLLNENVSLFAWDVPFWFTATVAGGTETAPRIPGTATPQALHSRNSSWAANTSFSAGVNCADISGTADDLCNDASGSFDDTGLVQNDTIHTGRLNSINSTVNTNVSSNTRRIDNLNSTFSSNISTNTVNIAAIRDNDNQSLFSTIGVQNGSNETASVEFDTFNLTGIGLVVSNIGGVFQFVLDAANSQITSFVNSVVFDVNVSVTSNFSVGGTAFFVDTSDGQVGIGTSTPDHTLHLNGHMLINRTADATDLHALEITANAAGFGDYKALDIDYITGALGAGSDEAVILVNIDESAATGGTVVGLEVIATEGAAKIVGLEVGALVFPVLQLSGVFVNPDSAVTVTTGTLPSFISTSNDSSIFVNNNDNVTIGSAAKFEEIEFLLNTTASGAGIKPVFEYSTGAGLWATFVPTDGTNGMKNTGVIVWEDSDIPLWAVDGNSEFLIRINRTQNSISTTPIESKVQIAATVEYMWDKEGRLDVNSVNTSSTILVGGLSNVSTTHINGTNFCIGTVCRDNIWNLTTGVHTVDTNETVRFTALIGTDCDAGDFMDGVDADGTPSCGTPAAGGGAGDKWLVANGFLSPNGSATGEEYDLNGSSVTLNQKGNWTETFFNVTGAVCMDGVCQSTIWDFENTSILWANVTRLQNEGNLTGKTASGDLGNVYPDPTVVNTQGLDAANITAGELVDARVADAITVSGGVLSSNSVDGTWSTTAALTIGDGGDAININTDDWDITATGTVTGTSIASTQLTDGGTIGFEWVDAEVADAITLAGGTLGSNTFAASTVLTGNSTFDGNVTIKDTRLYMNETPIIGLEVNSSGALCLGGCAT